MSTSVTLMNSGVRYIRDVKQLDERERAGHPVTHLNLHCNHICTIENIPCLRWLKHLNLSSNFIESMKGLEHAPNLITLNLASNRLSCIEGVSALHSLRKLFVPYNSITQLNGLSKLYFQQTVPCLQVLDVRQNQLTDTQSLAALADLDILQEFSCSISECSTNTVCALPQYTQFVVACVPSLLMLDGTAVTRTASISTPRIDEATWRFKARNKHHHHHHHHHRNQSHEFKGNNNTTVNSSLLSIDALVNEARMSTIESRLDCVMPNVKLPAIPRLMSPTIGDNEGIIDVYEKPVKDGATLRECEGLSSSIRQHHSRMEENHDFQNTHSVQKHDKTTQWQYGENTRNSVDKDEDERWKFRDNDDVKANVRQPDDTMTVDDGEMNEDARIDSKSLLHNSEKSSSVCSVCKGQTSTIRQDVKVPSINRAINTNENFHTRELKQQDFIDQLATANAEIDQRQYEIVRLETLIYNSKKARKKEICDTVDEKKNLERKLSTTLIEIDRVKDELEMCKNKLAHVQRSNTDLRNNLAKKNDQLHNLNQSEYNVKLSVEKNTLLNADLKEELHSQAVQIEHANMRVQQFRESSSKAISKMHTQQQQLVVLEQQNQHSLDELNTLRAYVSDQENNTQHHLARNDELMQQLTREKHQMNEMRKTMTSQKLNASKIQAEFTRVSQDREAFKQLLRAALQHQKKCQREIQVLRQAEQQRKRDDECVYENEAERNEERNQFVDTIAQLESTQAELEQELAQSYSTIDNHKLKVKSLTTHLDELEAQFSSATSKQQHDKDTLRVERVLAEDLRKQIIELKHERDESNKRLTEDQTTTKHLNKQLQTNFDASQQRVRDVEDRMLSLDESLDKMCRLRDRLEHKCEDQAKIIHEKCEAVEFAQHELTQLQQLVDEQRSQAQDANDALIKTHDEKIRSCENECVYLKTELNNAKTSLNTCRNDLERVSTMASNSGEREKRYQSELRVLVRQLQQHKKNALQFARQFVDDNKI